GMKTFVLGVAPVAGVCLIAGVLVNAAQSGIKPARQALVPAPKRLNPMTGARNVFGTRLLFETAKNLAKVAVVGAIVAQALIPRLTEVSATVGTNPAALGALLSKLVFALA